MGKKIPIKTAKEIAKEFEYNQVLIFAWDKENNRQNVTTFGKSTEDCDQIAKGGNYIKEHFLGWPHNECCAEPDRVTKLKKQIEEIKKIVLEVGFSSNPMDYTKSNSELFEILFNKENV